MATTERKVDSSDKTAATRGEIAEYLRDLINDLITLATSARMPRVAKHLEAAYVEAERQRDSQSLNS